MERKYNNCSVAYWGEPDIHLKFCEEKYSTPYIAEYYNSMSAISYMIVGCLLCLYKKREIGLWVFLLGVGTFIMHSTLRYYGQWCDEISMLMVEAVSIKKLKKLKNHNIFVCIILFLYMYFQSSIFFLTTFFGLLLWIGYLCVDKLKNRNVKIVIYTFLMVFSFIFWLFDQFLCGVFPNINFHALWHVGTSLAILFGFLSI